MKSGDLNNSKTTLGWKPPLKIDLKESSDKCSTFCSDSNKQNIYYSQEKKKKIEDKLQKYSFVEEAKSNFSNSNDSIYFKEHVKLNEKEVSDAESFTGNSDETVLYGEYSNQKQLMNFKEDLQDPDVTLNNFSNIDKIDNSLKSQESGIPHEDSNENASDVIQKQALIEDPTFFHVNNESQIRNIYSKIQAANLPINENSFEESIFDSINNQYKDSNSMYKKDLNESNENECFDESENLLIELNEQSEIIATECNNNIKDNKPSQDSIKEDIVGETKVFNEFKPDKKLIDDSFDFVDTNSQLLQLERQVKKSSSNIEIKESNNISLNNNIEIIKRCSTSMTVQTEWQKNLLKSMIKDINELK